MLTRIIDRKIPCVHIHVYRITKNWGLGPYNSLRHADNRYFSALSNAKSKGSARVLLGEGSGKIWTCFCWEKGNFIMITEFKYGQTWNIWPSPLSLSLHKPFKKPKLDITVIRFPGQNLRGIVAAVGHRLVPQPYYNGLEGNALIFHQILNFGEIQGLFSWDCVLDWIKMSNRSYNLKLLFLIE